MALDAQELSRRTIQYQGGLVAIKEGSHRVVYAVNEHPDLVIVAEKTAGESARVIALAQRVTNWLCDAFEPLRKEGVPIALVAWDTATSFVARRCNILPCKVAVRCEAYGRYCQRYPEHQKGRYLIPPAVEFFLRTTGRQWKERTLIIDHPRVEYREDEIGLFDPTRIAFQQTPFLSLPETDVFPTDGTRLISKMSFLALRALEVLKRRWDNEDHRLVGFTAEFGLTPDGTMLLTDLVVNDDL